MKQTIAFFGLGAMGEPMAANLLRADFPVRSAVHRSTAGAERLSPLGLKLFPSPAEAADGADVIITILPADPEIKEFLLDQTFSDSLKPGSIIVDMSSATSDCVKELEAAYRPKGIAVIDAPVSGGVTGAEQGTLTIFGSGDETAFEEVRPALSAMGRELYYLGPCGTGKAFKNLNNLLSVGNTVLVSEAFRIARENGLDTGLLYDVINASSGTSASFKARWPRMEKKNFSGGFQLALARKDVGNALKLGGELFLPISALVYRLLETCGGYDAEDMAAVVKAKTDRQEK